MPPRRTLGVSGSAVLAASMGAYLVYIGIKKVPFTEGLRLILRGENPKTLATARQSTAAPLSDTSSSGGKNVGETLPKDGYSLGGPVPYSDTVSVHGMRVHKNIAAQVEAMYQAAKADGITLVGDGWRSSATQAALRLKNGCTCSNSSSCCRVPTAPVGKSMHEQGLAIDFRGVRSKEHPVFVWMKRNGARFGFKNLPSETWHWSTTGT